MASMSLGASGPDEPAVNPQPDGSTILRFRHLLEKYMLAVQMLLVINDMLRDKGLMLRAGTVVGNPGQSNFGGSRRISTEQGGTTLH